MTRWSLDKLMHLDFRRWRPGRVVLTRGRRELRTAPCSKCKKVGLEVEATPRGRKIDHPLPWFIHVAIVDTLGYRLLPHLACAPKGVRGGPPVVHVPRVEAEFEMGVRV